MNDKQKAANYTYKDLERDLEWLRARLEEEKVERGYLKSTIYHLEYIAEWACDANPNILQRTLAELAVFYMQRARFIHAHPEQYRKSQREIEMKEIWSIECDPPRTIQDAFDHEPEFRKLVGMSYELRMVVRENPGMLVSEFMEELCNAVEAADPTRVVNVTEPN